MNTPVVDWMKVWFAHPAPQRRVCVLQRVGAGVFGG